MPDFPVDKHIECRIIFDISFTSGASRDFRQPGDIPITGKKLHLKEQNKQFTLCRTL
jgi:hypothetical protein